MVEATVMVRCMTFICHVLAAAFLVASPAGAQSTAGTKLSPEVKEYVMFDDAILALTHVRVIDGTGGSPRVDQTLIIRDGKITALGDSASTPIPPGAKILDLSDHTVVPGLVGMHDHMFYP
jgi:adenine deaminase